MDLGLKGKTAIVAAASKGLGRAVAAALAAEGTNVAIFSRSQDAIDDARRAIEDSAAEGAEVLALAADVTSPADLERVVDETLARFGTVDILYNNAGGPKPGLFDTLDDADWQRAWELNMMSTVRLTRLCLPLMRARRWGRIITGTSSSVKQPIDSLMLSNAVRSSVTAWSKTLSDQVAQHGITVNTLAPGRIETERLIELDTFVAQRTGTSLEQAQADKIAAIPTGRYGRPEEFAAAAVFLASERASYITGVTLLVDGGAFRGTY